MTSMTPNALAMLAKPSGHLVYPHTDAAHLAEAVGLFASTGLRQGETAILIMSASHCKPIRERLQREGFNLQELESTGQLVCASAEELIPTFLFDGIVDEHRFKTTFGAMIENAKSFNGKRRSVRVFGEMVDLLWQSNPRITQRIEELWNEVIEAHSVPLLCAYSLAGTKPGAFPASLIACHSHEVA
jgi:MEDS: MEthanogen/methylotroph, DcmR Sensory domain